MAVTNTPPPAGHPVRRYWPWLLLAVMAVPAVWHAVYFHQEPDDEFPRVVRPTFSPHPPPAYRLAEPGDTIDRIAIYVSSMAVVLSAGGWLRGRHGGRRPWLTALAVSLAAFWYAANPWPTLDGWHGLAWRTALDPAVPTPQRVALAAAACALAALGAWGLGFRASGWVGLWDAGRRRGVLGLLAAAVVLAAARQVDVPGDVPRGYWPRWAFVWALVAFTSALIRAQPPAAPWRLPARLGVVAAAGVVWYVLVLAGIDLTWYHRPIARLREVVPGRIYMSAMPTGRGLEVAHARHHFKTIINLFPEDTPYRSPRLPEELEFARRYGIHYLGSPADVASSNAFLDSTLALARDPGAWPILVHCHACMDRTPAWVGIYKFVEQGVPLDEVFRFIEGHRGYRPKASVTLLYNRVLPRLAPERFMNDPTAALLHRCAEGTPDPYYSQLAGELGAANREGPAGVFGVTGTAEAVRRPSLTPRR